MKRNHARAGPRSQGCPGLQRGSAAPASGQIPTDQLPLTTRGLHLLICLTHSSESPVLPQTQGGPPCWPGVISRGNLSLLLPSYPGSPTPCLSHSLGQLSCLCSSCCFSVRPFASHCKPGAGVWERPFLFLLLIVSPEIPLDVTLAFAVP